MIVVCTDYEVNDWKLIVNEYQNTFCWKVLRLVFFYKCVYLQYKKSEIDR